MELGRENPGDPNEDFCMTVSACGSRAAPTQSPLCMEKFRGTCGRGLFPGKPEDEVPIGHITNGVHVPSWLAPQMFRLYDRHLGTGWQQNNADPAIWEGIENVDDGELWETHLHLKSRLLDFVRQRVVEQAERRDESAEMLQRLGRVLSPDALTIGFARRFATYKRADLILADIERLTSMVNDPKRPVQFIFAGKAHPRDEPGKKLLQQIAKLMRNPRVCRQVRLRRRLRHQRRPPLRAGRRCLAEQSPAPAGSLRHQRSKSRAERRPEPVGSRWLVGGSL